MKKPLIWSVAIAVLSAISYILYKVFKREP
jgi:hypothetical protein